MKSLLLSFSVLLSLSSIAQEDSLFQYVSDKDRSNQFGGINAYYFWEEDNGGYIKDNSFKRAFKLNHSILLNNKSENGNIQDSVLIRIIKQYVRSNALEDVKSNFHLDRKEKITIPLKKINSQTINSVVYRNRGGRWESELMQNVLYFNVYTDSTRRFSHQSDSLLLKTKNLQQKAYGHYIVKQFWDDFGRIYAEQIFSFNGEDVSAYFFTESKAEVKHLLVFANGYRGPKRNKDFSDNLITRKDRYYYWLRLDRAFVKRIKPDDYFYIDGNFDISTSNHRSMTNFSLSYSRIKAIRKKNKNRYEFHLLNTTPNDSGFVFRRNEGKIAAQAYLSMRCNSPSCIEVKDTLDIVCHSMGYAYALGFTDFIKDFVVLRNCYIIAPENASAGGMDWTLFKEVWQYGSNLDESNPDPVWEQDGIAPQAPVKGIKEAKNGGRIFFPKNFNRKKGFLQSHALNHYRWIFDIEKGKAGAVY